jgi:hypothetical protein
VKEHEAIAWKEACTRWYLAGIFSDHCGKWPTICKEYNQQMFISQVCNFIAFKSFGSRLDYAPVKIK